MINIDDENNEKYIASASLNNIRCSTRKMKLIVDLIRNEEIENALSILSNNSNIKKSLILKKLLLSLLSNWKKKYNKVNLNNYILFIKYIWVNQKKTIKRIRAVPQGRGHRIRKKSSSVVVFLERKKKIYGTKNKSYN